MVLKPQWFLNPGLYGSRLFLLGRKNLLSLYLQYYLMQVSDLAPFFFNKITSTKHPQNISEDCCWSTPGIVAAAVDQIKGRPIHPLEGSCSGFLLIPYWAAFDACSQRCFNPAAKKIAFY
jgi:hypothetical protein